MQLNERNCVWTVLIGLSCSISCGGAAETTADQETSTGGASDTSSGGDVGSGGNIGSGGVPSTSTGGDLGSGGMSEPSDDEPSPYEPIDPDVSIAGDGRLEEGGSVEGGQAHGWDTCYRPEVSIEEGGAAHGETFLLLRPEGAGDAVDEEHGVGEVVFWSDAAFEAEEPLSIYFETKTFSTMESLGSLSFALGVEGVCKPFEPATTIAMSDLKAGEEWATRCVELRPEQEGKYLVLWAEGEQFSLGIDGVRFGPPCQ